MIKDFLISFKENLNEKTRNPFLATYFIVWLIRNWELVFTILNFDEDFKLNDKVEFIHNYYDKNEFILGLLINVTWTLIVIIITYLLINITRYFTNISEKRINPWIYKITDSKSVVLKSEFSKILIDRNNIQERLDNERNLRFKAETQIKDLEDRLTKEELIKNSNADIIFEKLKDSDDRYIFLDIASKINNGEYLDENNNQGRLITYGLVQFESNSEDGSGKKYFITDLGKEVLDKIRQNEDFSRI